MPLTAIAVLLRIVSNPLANVFQKKLTNRGNPALLVNFLTFLVLGLCCVVPALRIDWTVFPPAFWGTCAVAGVFGATGNGLLVRALQSGDLSVLGPINAYKSVVGIFGGMLFLGEMPGLAGVAGIGLIVWGSYFVLESSGRRFSWAVLKRADIQYRLWAMVLTAIEAVFIKKIILYSSPGVSFIMWCWFGALFSLLLLPVFRVRTGRVLASAGKDIPLYLGLVLCVGLMQFATNYAFDRMNVGYALALFQLSAVVSILFGYRIFHERDIRRKLVGAAIMVAGSVLVILSQ